MSSRQKLMKFTRTWRLRACARPSIRWGQFISLVFDLNKNQLNMTDICVGPMY